MKREIFLLFLFLLLERPIFSIPIDLDSAMEMGENYSFIVKSKKSELNHQERHSKLSISQMGPSLFSSAEKSWYDKNNTFSNTNNNGESTTSSHFAMTLNQPVTDLIPGFLKIQNEFSYLKYNQYQLIYEKILARLESAQAYIQVQQALRTLDARKAATKYAEENYKETQILFDTGSVEKTKVDVLQTKAEAAAARLAEISAQKDLKGSLYLLGNKIGVENVNEIEITLEQTSVWEKVNPSVPSLESALNFALNNRPDLNAAEKNRQSAKYNVERSYFDYLPKMNFFTTYSSFQSEYENNLLNSNRNQFYYGLSFNWNIWDGGVQASRISENYLVKAKLKIEEEKLKEQIKFDIQNSLNELNTAIKSLNDAKEAFQAYEESFQLASIQYKMGDYSAINLIESQNKMTLAQVMLSNVRSELDLSWMKLQAALGHLPNTKNEEEKI